MPSGAGHDAAVFANVGIPTAMIFIRNEHGSHNPREAMAMSDFAQATSVLTEFLSRKALRGGGRDSSKADTPLRTRGAWIHLRQPSTKGIGSRSEEHTSALQSQKRT